jgi:hypothetical protein
MRISRFVAAILLPLLACAATGSAETLLANPTANNGGSSGWGIFFDVSPNGPPLTITEMTTASSAPAGGSFTIEVFTRTGTALGGPVGSGPGSSPAGWTSLGTAPATQGPVANGISDPINIPDINLTSGITGVAVLFTGAGPRYFGLGTGPYQNFSDANLTLVTGDARTVPFTPTGLWFSPRGLTGSLTYTVIPEPASLGAIALASILLLRRR